MDEYDDLRQRIENHLRRPVRDCDWDCLLEEKTELDEYLDKPEEIDLLADVVRRRERYYPSGPDGSRTNAQTPRSGTGARDTVDTDGLLRQNESRRAAVYSELVASLAAANDDVIAVRENLLGSRLLSRVEISAWMQSPAAALLDTWGFRDAGVPVVGHTAEIVKRPRRLRLHPGGVLVPLPLHTPSDLNELQYLDGEEVRAIRHARFSLIGDVAAVVHDLVDEFGWEESAATTFVLSGITPRISPLRASFQWQMTKWIERATISIQAEPWIPAETVERAYRRVQQHLLGGDRKNRQLGARPLDALSFYLKQLRAGAKPRMASNGLTLAWNRENPDRLYQDRSGIARDIRRIRLQLQQPGYRTRTSRVPENDSQADSHASGDNAPNAADPSGDQESG